MLRAVIFATVLAAVALLSAASYRAAYDAAACKFVCAPRNVQSCSWVSIECAKGNTLWAMRSREDTERVRMALAR